MKDKSANQVATVLDINAAYKIQFAFPMSVINKGTFESITQIIEYMNVERVERNLSSITWHKLTKGINKILKFVCKDCNARMTFRQNQGVYHIDTYNVNHSHSNKECKTAEQAKIQCKNQQIKQLSKVQQKDEILIQEAKSIKQIAKKQQRRFQQHDKKFEALKKYFQENKIQFICENEENLVFASKFMQENYARYGQYIYIDIFVEKSFSQHLCIFYGEDCNRRHVIFAVGITRQKNTNKLAQILEYFFTIYTTKPQTIIINQRENQLYEALKQINNFNGLIIYNNWQVLKDICIQLTQLHKKSSKQNPEQIMHLLVSQLKQIAKAKKKQDAQISLNKILTLILQNSHFEGVFSKLLQMGERIFYWQMDQGHAVGLSRLGMSRDKNYTIAKYTKAQEKQKQTNDINNFIKRMLKQVEQTYAMIKQQFIIFTDCIDQCYNDPRLLKLKKHVESIPYEIFLGNYVEARQKYSAKTQGGSITVTELDTGIQFQCKKWSCPCRQLQRTGLPCPHLIRVAIECPLTQYKELLKSRWIKL